MSDNQASPKDYRSTELPRASRERRGRVLEDVKRASFARTGGCGLGRELVEKRRGHHLQLTCRNVIFAV
jgi:hypothetical protein